MEESCKLYRVKDGDPKNLSEDNLISMGAHTIFNTGDCPVRTGDGLKMSLVREEMMDETVQLRIIHIDGESPRKLIICQV